MILKVVKDGKQNIGFNTNLNFKDLTEIMGYLFARDVISDWSVEFFDKEEINAQYDEDFKLREIELIKSQV